MFIASNIDNLRSGFVTGFSNLCTLLLAMSFLASCAVQQTQTNITQDEPKKVEALSKSVGEPYDKWSKHDTTSIKENKKNRPESTLSFNSKIKEIDPQRRMLLKNVDNTLPMDHVGKKYSFKAEDISLRDALNKFASENNLHIIVDQDVEGDSQVAFSNEPLERAIELILGSYSYFWHWEEGILRVSRLQTKIFVMDYLRLVRSGNGYNSSSNSEGAKEASAGSPSNSSIQQTDNVAFWDELESQLKAFVSDQGRLVTNRLSGTIQYTDQPSRIQEVESFLQSLQSALHRQVVIDARIMEVTLRDDEALGIDWTKISINDMLTGATSNIVTNNNSFGVKANTLRVESFEGLLSALEEQGSVRIVSQPRIRTMNNQPSMIKVGTDKTFFTKSSTRTLSMAGISDEVTTEKPKTVTEGLVLSLTPQISQDRWVMLDISPVITRIVETTVSSIGSTAPVLDIKQASTLVRARDGEMIILGGLIQDDEIKTERRVPYLSDIPWLGYFFQGSYSTKIKKELVIFLVPRIVI